MGLALSLCDVSFLTERDMFLSGQGILGRHGIDYQDRAVLVKAIESSQETEEFQRLLKENQIDFLYFYGPPKLAVDINQTGVKKFFQNNSIAIYQINLLFNR